MATFVELMGETEIGTIGEALNAIYKLDLYIDVSISSINYAGGLAGKVGSNSKLDYANLIIRVMLSGPGSSMGLIIGNINGSVVDLLPDG